MSFDQYRGSLQTIIDKLRQIERHTKCASCGGDTNITSSGVGVSVPVGFKSVSIVKTSSTGTVNVTMSDASVYPMTVEGEVLVSAASPGGVLPAFTIATGDGATWKWQGIK